MNNKEFLKVVQAYDEGKAIQQKVRGFAEWKPFDGKWNTVTYTYRIKPEEDKPKYRPYLSAEEVMEDMKNYSAWVKLRSSNTISLITSFNNEFICVGGRDKRVSYKDAFMEYDWEAFTHPFGKRIEEGEE